MATAIVVPLQPLPSEDVVLPPELKDMRLVEWDYGLFEQEIQRLGIVTKQGEVNDTVIKKGTFNGTTKALTEMFRRVEKRHGSYFDVMNFEPTTPQNFSLAKKRELYTWAAPDSYPPHLAIIPLGDKYEDKLIFDEVRLADTQNLLGAVIPDTLIDFIDHGNPSDGGSIAALELTNRTMRAEKKDVMEDPNIGDRDDWFSDALFAQSQLTGPNPMTLKQASKDWIKRFILTAKERKNSDMESFLISLEPESLYIQDNSYVRDAVGAAGDDVLKSDYGPNGMRFACCSVTLFHLDDAGTLHPLAIVLDYKRAMKFSVVKFNKFLRPVQAAPTAAAQAKQLAAEKVDWPWRYAKLCAQVSDWVTHNLQIHLVNTHLVEEAVIVATQRSFENDHPVYRLLQPHWIKTLSLNASARASLVPGVVTPIVGLTPTQVQAYVKDAYYRFDWQGQYVPKDLETRGFPVQKLYTDKKYHNYAYAKNIYLMWQTLHKFVSSALRIRYKNDGDVQADQWIKNWSTEMRSDIGGRMKSFPIIKDFAQLVDAVVMSIHIASPQHNAVNYLQAFYGSFVINKPPCLCKEVISSYDALDAVKEADLLAALPVGKDHGPLWLLASHLPYLLSYRVADDQTLMNYAFSLWKLSLDLKPPNPTLVSIASEFYTTLRVLVLKFGKHNTDLDEHLIPYTVMDPSTTAISILI